MRSRVLCVALCWTGVLAGLSGQAPRPRSADFVRPGETATLPAPATGAADRITASGLATHIAVLASPGFEGRGLGQPGLEVAAEYIAAMLAKAGVPPLTSGEAPPHAPAARYFQAVPVRAVTDARGTLTVEVRRGDEREVRTFVSGVDVLFQERAPASLSSSLVFAGYGIRESSPARDDYRDLDVRGRTVVLLAGVPDGDAWRSDAMVSKYASEGRRERFEAKVALAQSQGARAVVAIERGALASALAGGAATPSARYFVPHDAGAEEDGTIPLLRVSESVGSLLLGSVGLSVASAGGAAPRSLPDTTITAALTGSESLVMTRNVLAALPGSDPALRQEAVIIGAHMDHLGRTGRGVFPGADDNASGTAALLEMAAAMAAGRERPKRTVVFAFWTGEEEGHLGSEYYSHQPAWPLEKTVVYLNLDMIGHAWTADEIRQVVTSAGLERADAFLAAVKPDRFIEVGLPPTAPDLEPALKQAARAAGVALHLDWTDGRHGGSDYRAFVRKGRPFVRFFGNYFPGYHEPSDTPDDVAQGLVLRIARLALGTAWLVADR